VTRRSVAGLTLAVLAVAAVVVGATTSAAGPREREATVTVAVVDTGIDPDAALDGRLDLDASRSVVPGESSIDVDGHGTSMASVVHANAPDARLVAVKASGRDGTSDARLAAAVDHAVAAGAQVVLVSMSGPEALPETTAAIGRAARAGVLVVVAAGNDGVDLDARPRFPASIGDPDVVAVAALGADGRVLASSNQGAQVRSAGLGRGVPACDLDGATTVGGTSAAAALVAARAARLMGDGDGMSPSDTRAALEGSPVLDAAPVRC
jgi:hypothetical protein